MCCLSHDSVPCIPSLLNLTMSPPYQDFKFLMGMDRLELQGILSTKKVLASPAPVASNLELNNVVEPKKDEKFQQYFPILVIETSFFFKKSNFRYSKHMLRWSLLNPNLLESKNRHPYMFQGQLECAHICLIG